MAEQLELGARAGERARDEALARVAAACPPGWMDCAALAIRDLAAERPEGFTSDHVWDRLEERGVSGPPEPRAMGVAFRRARSAGVVEPTADFVLCERASRHRAPMRVWRGS